MPGVPDVYQGTELWDYSLVDPDNRRPVDFGLRRELLARIDDGWLPPVDESGAAKLLVTSRTLRLRRQRPELFTGYRPVFADGRVGGARTGLRPRRRGGGGDPAAGRIVPPRRLARHHAVTRRPQLHGSLHEHQLGGSRLAVADLLHTYPVALLVKES